MNVQSKKLLAGASANLGVSHGQTMKIRLIVDYLEVTVSSKAYIC